MTLIDNHKQMQMIIKSISVKKSFNQLTFDNKEPTVLNFQNNEISISSHVTIVHPTKPPRPTSNMLRTLPNNKNRPFHPMLSTACLDF
jgi:P pilus assembly chaperone PapD